MFDEDSERGTTLSKLCKMATRDPKYQELVAIANTGSTVRMPVVFTVYSDSSSWPHYWHHHSHKF